MSNFLKFIDEDIEAKKTLIATMPVNTKTNIRKFNEKIDDIMKKYTEYKMSVKKYLDTKSKSFNIKEIDENLEKLNNEISTLEHVRFILNPTNTYFEKLGFDNLIYEMNNYCDLNFNDLNEIICQFINKFELVGIYLTKDDFDYTCYVNEYMSSFLEERNKKNNNYDKVVEKFEKIYWTNPEIIEHIELNFRKLIKKYAKKFINYIDTIQKDVMLKNSIDNYEDCLKRLKIAYDNLNASNKESISDIIEIAKVGEIDINNFFEDSKVRISTYNELMMDPANLDDKETMNKFYESLEKLKSNVEEYSNYIKFLPIIIDFKTEYEKEMSSEEKSSSKNNEKKLKEIESQINDKEKKLDKLNKKIFNGLEIFKVKNKEIRKQLKIDSIKLAKELYDLYKVFDQEYFKDKVMSILSYSLTVSELLHLYYSFDYFKKMAVKKVFNFTDNEEITKYSESFDLFAMNISIMNNVLLFEETDIGKIIMNKYRLDNINLTEDALNPDNLSFLLEKIKLLLRIKEIEKSSTTIEKIWFMVAVEKINKAENKKE